MILGIHNKVAGVGYIAGTGDGIVTIMGAPESRKIWLLDAKTMEIERVFVSLKSGRYIFAGLRTDKEYLVMVRDYKKEYEPFVWDYVKPAEDLSVYEQRVLWQSWQT